MTDAQGLRVFISYARSDASDFAEELMAALEAAGFDPFLDRHDIGAGEDWETRLLNLLQQADTVIYVVTPASVRSERVNWEIARAASLSKRLIPVVAIEVAEEDTPEPLRRLNFVYFSAGHSFGAALKTLASALRTDLTWVREHTRLAEIGLRWNDRARPDELLLRGSELGAAQAWLKNWRSGTPEPTTIHRDFINASDAAEQARTSVERTRLEERQRVLDRLNRTTKISLTLVVLLFAVMCVSGYFLWRFRQQVADKDANLADVQQQLDEKTQAVAKVAEQLQQALDAAAKPAFGTPAQGATAARPGVATVQEAVRQARLELGWDIDVFWCEGPGADRNRSRAQAIVDLLNAERARQTSSGATPPGGLTFAVGRVRLRALSQGVNAREGYRVRADEVRAEDGEAAQAANLRSFVGSRGGVVLGDRRSSMKTLYYLSVFMCGTS